VTSSGSRNYTPRSHSEGLVKDYSDIKGYAARKDLICPSSPAVRTNLCCASLALIARPARTTHLVQKAKRSYNLGAMGTTKGNSGLLHKGPRLVIPQLDEIEFFPTSMVSMHPPKALGGSTCDCPPQQLLHCQFEAGYWLHIHTPVAPVDLQNGSAEARPPIHRGLKRLDR
jgi:hypothetical protein